MENDVLIVAVARMPVSTAAPPPPVPHMPAPADRTPTRMAAHLRTVIAIAKDLYVESGKYPEIARLATRPVGVEPVEAEPVEVKPVEVAKVSDDTTNSDTTDTTVTTTLPSLSTLFADARKLHESSGYHKDLPEIESPASESAPVEDDSLTSSAVSSQESLRDLLANAEQDHHDAGYYSILDEATPEPPKDSPSSPTKTFSSSIPIRSYQLNATMISSLRLPVPKLNKKLLTSSLSPSLVPNSPTLSVRTARRTSHVSAMPEPTVAAKLTAMSTASTHPSIKSTFKGKGKAISPPANLRNTRAVAKKLIIDNVPKSKVKPMSDEASSSTSSVSAVASRARDHASILNLGMTIAQWKAYERGGNEVEVMFGTGVDVQDRIKLEQDSVPKTTGPTISCEPELKNKEKNAVVEDVESAPVNLVVVVDFMSPTSVLAVKDDDDPGVGTVPAAVIADNQMSPTTVSTIKHGIHDEFITVPVTAVVGVLVQQTAVLAIESGGEQEMVTVSTEVINDTISPTKSMLAIENGGKNGAGTIPAELVIDNLLPPTSVLAIESSVARGANTVSVELVDDFSPPTSASAIENGTMHVIATESSLPASSTVTGTIAFFDAVAARAMSPVKPTKSMFSMMTTGEPAAAAGKIKWGRRKSWPPAAVKTKSARRLSISSLTDICEGFNDIKTEEPVASTILLSSQGSSSTLTSDADVSTTYDTSNVISTVATTVGNHPTPSCSSLGLPAVPILESEIIQLSEMVTNPKSTSVERVSNEDYELCLDYLLDEPDIPVATTSAGAKTIIDDSDTKKSSSQAGGSKQFDVCLDEDLESIDGMGLDNSSESADVTSEDSETITDVSSSQSAAVPAVKKKGLRNFKKCGSFALANKHKAPVTSQRIDCFGGQIQLINMMPKSDHPVATKAGPSKVPAVPKVVDNKKAVVFKSAIPKPPAPDIEKISKRSRLPQKSTAIPIKAAVVATPLTHPRQASKEVQITTAQAVVDPTLLSQVAPQKKVSVVEHLVDYDKYGLPKGGDEPSAAIKDLIEFCANPLSRSDECGLSKKDDEPSAAILDLIRFCKDPFFPSDEFDAMKARRAATCITYGIRAQEVNVSSHLDVLVTNGESSSARSPFKILVTKVRHSAGTASSIVEKQSTIIEPISTSLAQANKVIAPVITSALSKGKGLSDIDALNAQMRLSYKATPPISKVSKELSVPTGTFGCPFNKDTYLPAAQTTAAKGKAVATPPAAKKVQFADPIVRPWSSAGKNQAGPSTQAPASRSSIGRESIIVKSIKSMKSVLEPKVPTKPKVPTQQSCSSSKKGAVRLTVQKSLQKAKITPKPAVSPKGPFIRKVTWS